MTPSFTILVVEDEPLIGMTLVDMLEDMGHRAVEAFSAGEALERFAAEPAIDIVITDLGLPDRPGDALARDLRARRPGLPIIFASGASPNARTVVPGAAHLSKPFRMEDLRAVIGAVTAAA